MYNNNESNNKSNSYNNRAIIISSKTKYNNTDNKIITEAMSDEQNRRGRSVVVDQGSAESEAEKPAESNRWRDERDEKETMEEGRSQVISSIDGV